VPLAVDGMKQCTKCGEIKPVSEYGKNKHASDNLITQCRSCIKVYRQNISEEQKSKNRLSVNKYREKNRDEINKRRRSLYHQDKTKQLEWNKDYRQRNKEKIREYHRKYSESEPYAYKAIYNKTGHFYYGSSFRDYTIRIREHKNYGTTGLGFFMNKHNLTGDDLEVEQYFCSNEKEARDLERKLISENIDNPLCLNRIQGAIISSK